MARVACTLLLFILISATALAQEPHRELLAEKFQRAIEDIASTLPGVMGVPVIDIESGETFGVNDDLVFPQGSAIKVSILVAMYVRQAEGDMELDQPVPIRAEDRVGGSGYLRHFGDGTSSLSLHDLAVLMITVSDNMATNLLIDRVGTDNVNSTMTELGFPNTKLQRKMIRPEQSARGNENLSTPAEAARLMARILTCDLPIDEADCAQMKAILAIPHSGPVGDGTPDGVTVLHKGGSIRGVRTGWGAIDLPGRPYAIAVMGNYGETDEISAEIEKIAALSHWYFTRLAGATPYGTRVPVELLEQVEAETDRP